MYKDAEEEGGREGYNNKYIMHLYYSAWVHQRHRLVFI